MSLNLFVSPICETATIGIVKMVRTVFLNRLVRNPNVRCFSTSSVCNGKRNFRMFPLYNFRGSRKFKEQQKQNPDPDIFIYTYGVREPGYKDSNNKFHFIPEMVPELIVPDLTDCKLKPYVSYRTSEVYQNEFTAQDLFDSIYIEKIEKDFNEGQLDENGNSLRPNVFENLTPEEATKLARQTGSDIFCSTLRRKPDKKL